MPRELPTGPFSCQLKTSWGFFRSCAPVLSSQDLTHHIGKVGQGDANLEPRKSRVGCATLDPVVRGLGNGNCTIIHSSGIQGLSPQPRARIELSSSV